MYSDKNWDLSLPNKNYSNYTEPLFGRFIIFDIDKYTSLEFLDQIPMKCRKYGSNLFIKIFNGSDKNTLHFQYIQKNILLFATKVSKHVTYKL